MNNPKISVVIPVYNVEKYIARCIDSVLAQTFQDFEIILVDDCSPDNSAAIIKSYEDARIIYIKQERNKGPMTAREVGYMQAKGDYITFCDSDDTLPSEALKVLYDEIVRTNADVVAGKIVYIDVNNTQTIWKSELKYGNDSHAVYKSLLNKEFGHNLCGKLFSKEILQSYEYESYDNFTNAEDAMLFYQVVANCKKIVCVDYPVYNYYQNLASSTNVRLSDRALENIIKANVYILHRVRCYPDLMQYAYRQVAQSIFNLYGSGYDVHGLLRELLAKYNLQDYSKLRNVYMYFPLKQYFGKNYRLKS